MSIRYLVNFSIKENLSTINTDLLVVGSGVAGLFTAFCAAQRHKKVIVLTKNLSESNTRYAQGGIAVVLDHIHDSFREHIQDTLQAGGGICDPEAVQIMVNDGPPLVKQLMNIGTHFDKEKNGDLMLTREGGHSHYRVLHSDGDQTGKEIARALEQAVLSHPYITVINNSFAIDIITSGNECGGIIALNETESYQLIYAKATVLATGGLGQIYSHTTNPEVATADGMGMAYRAGAEMMNMAFVQFHPTALALPGKPSFLVSEAVRGEGAVLRNKIGQRFMLNKYPRAELEPRNVVAQAMVAEMNKDGTDFINLDIKPLITGGIDFATRFPYINKKLLEYGVNPLTDYIPVAPAAHYAMGGVKTDLNGRTSINRLYACGEVACSGLHGANRLASNSLLDGLVFSHRISEDFIKINYKDIAKKPYINNNNSRIPDIFDSDGLKRNIQKTMWRNVGLVRSQETLLRSIKELGAYTPYLWQALSTRAELETANLLMVSQLIARSALWRQESRGSHYRLDYPQQIEEYKRSDIIRR